MELSYILLWQLDMKKCKKYAKNMKIIKIHHFWDSFTEMDVTFTQRQFCILKVPLSNERYLARHVSARDLTLSKLSLKKITKISTVVLILTGELSLSISSELL